MSAQATTPFQLRRATPADAGPVSACVEAAHSPWTARIGHKPAPMQDDYAVLIDTGHVVVADAAGSIVGMLVLAQTPDGFLLENVAVLPSWHGQGVGRALLQHAEHVAANLGHASLYLYTNERMTENIALYARAGYVEYARRTEHGHARVFMRKPLVGSELDASR